MPIPKKTMRTLQDIRTSSQNVEQTLSNHQLHLRLSYLEIEKDRRSKEKENMQFRLQKIESRLQDIEDEEKRLMQCLNERKNIPKLGANPSSDTPKETIQGFTIQY
jgi:hypothetical protein